MIGTNLDVGYSSERSIGFIFIKVDYLLETYKSLRYDRNGGLDGNFSLLKFSFSD